MRELTVAARQRGSLPPAKAAAIALRQDTEIARGDLPQSEVPDRLAWPVAAVAILAASLGLWLAVAGLTRLLLG